MINKRFSRLVVLGDTGKRSKDQSIMWKCRCDCGQTTFVRTRDLNSGNTKSCGCLHSEISSKLYKKMKTKHGHCIDNKVTRTYKSWDAMKQRCLNPNNIKYPLYGGRGIYICAEWESSFEKFLEDMGQRPDGTSLDRINPDGNYEPSNCRWADGDTQRKNRRIKL